MAFSCALAVLLLFSPQQDFLAEGLKALDANQPAAAEPLLRQAVQTDPNDFGPHFNLALALSLQQKDDEAIGELRRTLELKPGLYQADLNLGTLLLRNKRAAEAVPVLKEALESAPDSAERAARANLLYAQALYETSDLAQAEQYYRAAAGLDPKSAAAQSGLGHVLLKEAKLAEAQEHLEASATLDPRYRDDLRELAAAKQRLVQTMVADGNFAAAIPSLESAVKESPSVSNRLALADAYKMNKRMDKALEQLRLAAASDPANYDVHMDLGRELRDRREFLPAAEQFRAAAKIHPDSVKAWNELAAVLVVNEDYAAGLAALDRVRALGKEVPGDYFYRALSLEKLRQPKPAMEAYRQFLAADGGKMPDQEFQARQRIRIIENELNRR